MAAVSATELQYFRTFGFLHRRAEFSAGEMRAIVREADATLDLIDRMHRCSLSGPRPEGGVAGIASDGSRDPATGRSCSKFVEESAALTRTLVEDPRVFGLVSTLLGQDDFVWSTSNHIEASPAGPAFQAPAAGGTGIPVLTREHGWHCDIAGVREAAIKRVKVMVYLTPTTRAGGALQVLPGTHTAERQADPGLRSLMGCHGMNTTIDPEWADATFGVRGAELPGHALEAVPGDIIVWQLGLYHAVYNHLPDRRLIQLNFSSRPVDSEQWVSLYRNMQSAFRPHPRVLRHPNRRIRALCIANTTEAAAEAAAHWAAVEKGSPFPDVDINACHTSAAWRARHGRKQWREEAPSQRLHRLGQHVTVDGARATI
eukprot:SAG22_NODE_1330_length_4709_cov_25.747722_1_plen_372_part_00